MVQKVSENVWQVASGDSILRISGKDLVVEDLVSNILSEPKPKNLSCTPP